MANRFDLGHDLDIWIFMVKLDLDDLVTKVRCKDLPDSDRGDFRCRRAVDSSILFVIWITNRYTENIIFFEHESDIGLKTQLTPHKHVGLIFLKTGWLIAKFVEKN